MRFEWVLETVHGADLDPSAVDTGSTDDVRPTGHRLVPRGHWSRAEEVPVPEGTRGAQER
ncbi:hypothetical protein [Streptomyces sp. NPDC014623]|uniref:hypothetical protein n=1 Tax=Streptomyces sp. NPDC014623 TaxID=3364875 RepID=UPI0037011E83